MKILGLDLGTNSIGWAVIDNTQNKILGTGVRVFPEGVENLGQGKKEMSKNATRRVHRQARRQFFRKRLRKIKLLELLIKHNMCPLSYEELKSWKYYDKSKGKAGMQFPSTEEFDQWLQLNPYRLRAEGLQRNLTLQEFGRILYHLIQRRGFWSNRKVKEEGKINQGNDNNIGIADAKEKIGTSSYPTLGAYLYDISYKDNEPYKRKLENGKEQRVRARYTLRQMYIDEFEQLWKKQSQNLGLDRTNETIKKQYLVGNPYKEGKKEYGIKKRLQHRIDYLKNIGVKTDLQINEQNPANSKLITEKQVPLKELLSGGNLLKQEESVLFYQRPLRIQKHLLDECTFEKTIRDENEKVIYGGKKPCPVSHPLAELRRAYEFINTIEYGDGIRLNVDQRKIVLDLINSKDKNFDFEEIPKVLKINEKFNYDDKHKVKGNYTHKRVKPLFKEETWEEHCHDIWHCFHFYSDSDQLIKKLNNDYGLKEKDFDKIRGKLQNDGTRKGGIILDDDYGSLSLKAIKNILPFLEKGYKYSNAVLLGGVKNAFGTRWEYFASCHEEIEQQIININKDKANKEGEAIEKIKTYLLSDDFGFEPDDKAFLRLYHHSQDTSKQDLKDQLNEPENIRNPLVQQALYELKNIVNSVSDEYLNNGERFGQIKVEMARDLKQSKQKRIDQLQNNRERERENDEARARLDEYGLAHSRQNIHKYLLWKELQDESGQAVCPYTNKTIPITELFNNNQFQIEHIIPYSVSLDDSFANKTICDAEENGKKGEHTPYQFYRHDQKKWEEIANRAFKVLPYQKAKRFTQKTIKRDDFISRQLNDTRYISREASVYLKQVCNDVRVFPGQLTAELRNKWGLDNILNPPIQVNGEANYGKVWAKMNDQGNPIAFFPRFNKRPDNEKGEFVITGAVTKEKFSSKYLAVTFEAKGQQDGKHWAKVKVGEPPVKLVKVLRPKPEVDDNEILLYGKTDNKGKFITRFLNNKLSNQSLENETSYSAKLSVISDKTQFFPIKEKSNLPKPKKNNILLYGKVEDGVFSSKIYTCEADVEDGKYNALLEVNLEDVTFHKVKNDAPETQKEQISVTGHVKDGNFHPSIDNKYTYNTGDTVEEGLYWALFEVKSNPYEFTIVENPQPKSENGELIEGSVTMAELLEADESTGEILKEEKKKFFFPSKGRDDHRHHAIDALVVALTEQSYLQQLSHFYAHKKDKKRGNQYNPKELSFSAPWDGFRQEAERHINAILVSHKKINRVLTKKKTRDPKTGKVYEGIGARGQLHREFIYGKRKAPMKEERFHKRSPLTDIKNNKHIDKIVDDNIQKLIINHLKSNYPEIDFSKNFDVPAEAFFKSDENGVKQPRLFLPNKNGEPVPVKKVRIRESIGGAKQLKETNQYVNPRNNHHMIIYKTYENKINGSVIPLWVVVERIIQKQEMIQMPSNAKELITSVEKNEMFIVGLNDINKKDIDSIDREVLSEHLYRVQKITTTGYKIVFRHHLASTLENDNNMLGISDIKKWEEYNPIKVKLTSTGRIEPSWQRTELTEN